MEVRDEYGPYRVCHVLDANANSYNPRKYADPNSQVTTFTARQLRKKNPNGVTAAYNPRFPKPMPIAGTNDVMWVSTRF